jgi:DHA1 family inner membrane transport protein
LQQLGRPRAKSEARCGQQFGPQTFPVGRSLEFVLMSQSVNKKQQEPQYTAPVPNTAPPPTSPQPVSPSPAVFHPNIVHLALAVGGFAIGITEFATMSLLPFFARDLHVSDPVAGRAISAYALGVVVGAPLIAVLSARIARRTVLIALMAFFAVMNGLSGLAPDFNSMLVLRFLAGLPHGAYFGIAMLVAASLVPADKRTVAVGRVILGLTVATTIACRWPTGLARRSAGVGRSRSSPASRC